MSDLTYADAIGIAQTLRNHYQAFERLTELLAMAADAEGYVRGHEETLAGLRRQIAALEQDKATAEQAATAAKADHQATQASLAVEAKTQQSAREADASQQAERLEAEYQRLKGARDSDIENLTAKREALDTAVAVKASELDALQKATELARDFLSRLRIAANG